ncbi:MAG TPA: peptidoglycan DD-metalloendopeptidase family protein [Stellaceae bacterium]|nr:peptidoglycan DD-metalloendopeptidase family protein [Stellaceae bacterium]
MITPAILWAKRLFPERQLLVRSGENIRYLTLPGWFQAGALLSMIVVIGSVGALIGAYHNLHKAIRRKEAEISAVSSRVAAVASLREQLAAADAQYLAMSKQFDEMTKQLDTAAADNETLRGSIEAAEARAVVLDKERMALEQRLHGAQQALASKSGNVKDLVHQLARNRTELQSAELARALLQNKLHGLQADSQSSHARTAQLKLELAAREHHLKELAAERDRLRSRLAQPIATLPSALARPEAAAASVPRPSRSYRSELERLIASTGIDLDKLLGTFGSLPPGEGGPYIALSTREEAQYEGKREAALEALARSLPLEAPLAHYVVDSPFGPRMDPFRHEMGFHSGVDLAAPYLSPVYSTAPGVVSFTGWQDGYGRVVEITHAHGIVTLYAHLHRILVARGERMRAHQKIGLLGSTGRSTGPHVHYEVRVNGVPVDPTKFLNAGRGVQLISEK